MTSYTPVDLPMHHLSLHVTHLSADVVLPQKNGTYPHFQLVFTSSKSTHPYYNEEDFTWLFNLFHKWAIAWDFQQCVVCDQQRLRSACAYAQSDQSLRSSLEYSMTVMLLIRDNLESLSLKGGCTGSHESTNVKMPHWWKSHATA